MKIPMIKALLYVLFFLIALFIPRSILAADFTTDYKVEYTLENVNQTITSDVKFNVKITHHRSDVFVKKFFLIFPNVFPIKNITAYDDNGEIKPNLSEEEDKIKIELEFTDPNTGKDSVNNFFIEFTQDNLFKINGSVWEVILPTIENRDQGVYQVVVNLPKNSDKKISVSKPLVDEINDQQLIWNNPKTKIIYAIFGDTQFYSTNLVYNLQNSKIVPVYTDIAFPPDTLYQKIFVNQISPRPEKFFLDTDGNYLARYLLKPKESKKVYFDGTIAVYNKARSEFKKILDAQIQSQKNYLLTAKDFWSLSSVDRYKNLVTATDIYNYLITNFSYDYKKVSSNLGRMGAEKALANPNQVVCTEFTDAFIALSREKGIFAREMEGYGFSSDSRLRPMSLTSDLLHAWPEYYDPQLKTWLQVDPTWENTSGINYLSSFDLNHLVFAIHGKDPRYPYPAGTYKTSNSKDILINPIAGPPKEISSLDLAVDNLNNTVYQQKKYQFRVTIDNKGNTFVYNQQFKVQTDQALSIYPTMVSIDQIAPGETRQVTIDYSPFKSLTKKNSFIKIIANDKLVIDRSITILPFYYDLALKFGYLGFFLLFIFFIILYAKKRRR